jgi:hypothetical protein
MKTKKFTTIYSKETHSFIPVNVVLIRNQHGWLYLANDDAQWYVNHTQDFKDITEEEIEKTLKLLVKAVKTNLLQK